MGWGRKERVSPFSIKKFLSLSAKNFVGECFQCFITFGYRKMLEIRVGGVGVTRGFPPKLFCLRISRHFFVEEFFCAVFKKTSGREKVYG